MPRKRERGSRATRTSLWCRKQPSAPRKLASKACRSSSSAVSSRCRARKRRKISPRRSITRCKRSLPGKRRSKFQARDLIRKPVPTFRDHALRRLRPLRDRRELTHDCRGALEAILGLLPVLEEHDLHIGSHACGRAFLLDEGDQPFRIGKLVVTELKHRTLRAGIDLRHIGAATQRFDADDVE